MTPTWQAGHVFARADLGVLHLTRIGAGLGYGSDGRRRSPVMALPETGLMFRPAEPSPPIIHAQAYRHGGDLGKLRCQPWGWTRRA